MVVVAVFRIVLVYALVRVWHEGMRGCNVRAWEFPQLNSIHEDHWAVAQSCSIVLLAFTCEINIKLTAYIYLTRHSTKLICFYLIAYLCLQVFPQLKIRYMNVSCQHSVLSKHSSHSKTLHNLCNLHKTCHTELKNQWLFALMIYNNNSDITSCISFKWHHFGMIHLGKVFEKSTWLLISGIWIS